jgi:hypothetical protein
MPHMLLTQAQIDAATLTASRSTNPHSADYGGPVPGDVRGYAVEPRPRTPRTSES